MQLTISIANFITHGEASYTAYRCDGSTPLDLYSLFKIHGQSQWQNCLCVPYKRIGLVQILVLV